VFRSFGDEVVDLFKKLNSMMMFENNNISDVLHIGKPNNNNNNNNNNSYLLTMIRVVKEITANKCSIAQNNSNSIVPLFDYSTKQLKNSLFNSILSQLAPSLVVPPHSLLTPTLSQSKTLSFSPHKHINDKKPEGAGNNESPSYLRQSPDLNIASIYRSLGLELESNLIKYCPSIQESQPSVQKVSKTVPKFNPCPQQHKISTLLCPNHLLSNCPYLHDDVHRLIKSLPALFDVLSQLEHSAELLSQIQSVSDWVKYNGSRKLSESHLGSVIPSQFIPIEKPQSYLDNSNSTVFEYVTSTQPGFTADVNGGTYMSSLETLIQKYYPRWMNLKSKPIPTDSNVISTYHNRAVELGQVYDLMRTESGRDLVIFFFTQLTQAVTQLYTTIKCAIIVRNYTHNDEFIDHPMYLFFKAQFDLFYPQAESLKQLRTTIITLYTTCYSNIANNEEFPPICISFVSDSPRLFQANKCCDANCKLFHSSELQILFQTIVLLHTRIQILCFFQQLFQSPFLRPVLGGFLSTLSCVLFQFQHLEHTTGFIQALHDNNWDNLLFDRAGESGAKPDTLQPLSASQLNMSNLIHWAMDMTSYQSYSIHNQSLAAFLFFENVNVLEPRFVTISTNPILQGRDPDGTTKPIEIRPGLKTLPNLDIITSPSIIKLRRIAQHIAKVTKPILGSICGKNVGGANIYDPPIPPCESFSKTGICSSFIKCRARHYQYGPISNLNGAANNLEKLQNDALQVVSLAQKSDLETPEKVASSAHKVTNLIRSGISGSVNLLTHLEDTSYQDDDGSENYSSFAVQAKLPANMIEYQIMSSLVCQVLKAQWLTTSNPQKVVMKENLYIAGANSNCPANSCLQLEAQIFETLVSSLPIAAPNPSATKKEKKRGQEISNFNNHPNPEFRAKFSTIQDLYQRFILIQQMAVTIPFSDPIIIASQIAEQDLIEFVFSLPNSLVSIIIRTITVNSWVSQWGNIILTCQNENKANGNDDQAVMTLSSVWSFITRIYPSLLNHSDDDGVSVSLPPDQGTGPKTQLLASLPKVAFLSMPDGSSVRKTMLSRLEKMLYPDGGPKLAKMELLKEAERKNINIESLIFDSELIPSSPPKPDPTRAKQLQKLLCENTRYKTIPNPLTANYTHWATQPREFLNLFPTFLESFDFPWRRIVTKIVQFNFNSPKDTTKYFPTSAISVTPYGGDRMLYWDCKQELFWPNQTLFANSCGPAEFKQEVKHFSAFLILLFFTTLHLEFVCQVHNVDFRYLSSKPPTLFEIFNLGEDNIEVSNDPEIPPDDGGNGEDIGVSNHSTLDPGGRIPNLHLSSHSESQVLAENVENETLVVENIKNETPAIIAATKKRKPKPKAKMTTLDDLNTAFDGF
jgi:hypothetical protein